MNILKSKRFVVRKSLIGKNQVIEFVNKKGDTVTYNHDKVYEVMKSKLESLPCWEKYKSYTATNNIPLSVRNIELVQQLINVTIGSYVYRVTTLCHTFKCNNMIVISKITGRDVSREYLALMKGIITRDEFELITLTIK